MLQNLIGTVLEYVRGFLLVYVKADAEEAEDGELSWNFFIGFQMEDIHHGLLGEVIDVDTTTVNTLFVVEGAEEEELLVPAQEEFIVGIDQKQKLITVELPEGLLNLEELEDDR